MSDTRVHRWQELVSTTAPKCPTCGDWHAAYALFPPACQYPGDRYTYFIDGKPAYTL